MMIAVSSMNLFEGKVTGNAVTNMVDREITMEVPIHRLCIRASNIKLSSKERRLLQEYHTKAVDSTAANLCRSDEFGRVLRRRQLVGALLTSIQAGLHGSSTRSRFSWGPVQPDVEGLVYKLGLSLSSVVYGYKQLNTLDCLDGLFGTLWDVNQNSQENAPLRYVTRISFRMTQTALIVCNVMYAVCQQGPKLQDGYRLILLQDINKAPELFLADSESDDDDF